MSHINVSTIVDAQKTQVFKILENVENYSKLVPDNIELKLSSSAYKMKPGAEYEFTIMRFGIHQILLLRVEDFKQDEYIEFSQSLGIFKKWYHTIKLEDHGEASTLLHHYVQYELPFGLFGRLYDDLYLREFITKILNTISNKIKKQLKGNS